MVFALMGSIGDNRKCRSPKKRQKLGFFANRGRHIKQIETKYGTYAYTVGLLYTHLALIGERWCGRYRSPQKSKFAQNCGFWPLEANTMNTFR